MYTFNSSVRLTCVKVVFLKVSLVRILKTFKFDSVGYRPVSFAKLIGTSATFVASKKDTVQKGRDIRGKNVANGWAEDSDVSKNAKEWVGVPSGQSLQSVVHLDIPVRVFAMYTKLSCRTGPELSEMPVLLMFLLKFTFKFVLFQGMTGDFLSTTDIFLGLQLKLIFLLLSFTLPLSLKKVLELTLPHHHQSNQHQLGTFRMSQFHHLHQFEHHLHKRKSNQK